MRFRHVPTLNLVINAMNPFKNYNVSTVNLVINAMNPFKNHSIASSSEETMAGTGSTYLII